MPESTSLTSRRAEISRSALEHNLALLSSRVDRLDLSGNALGHGVADIVAIASGVGLSRYSVSRESEAQVVRQLIPGIDLTVQAVDERESAVAYGLLADNDLNLKPVMTLSAQVLAVKSISAGGGVSYGYTWKAVEDGFLALIALGYADGFNRAWGNRVFAHANSHRYQAVGRVAMDAHSISTGHDELRVGDFVSYFGTCGETVVYAESLAMSVGCSPLSVTANFGARISRVVVP